MELLEIQDLVAAYQHDQHAPGFPQEWADRIPKGKELYDQGYRVRFTDRWHEEYGEGEKLPAKALCGRIIPSGYLAMSPMIRWEYLTKNE